MLVREKLREDDFFASELREKNATRVMLLYSLKQILEETRLHAQKM